ncbi:MAG: Asp-tRNA(Asn)/Glu-tRNA(Gln) amidotransferase subunit GatC [Chloroflexota bacterium]
MRLSRAQVLHIAELAKLSLTEDEVALLTEQLSDILAYFDRLNQLDTAALPATAQAIYRRNVLRADEVRPSLAPDQALANAPRRDDDLFVVKTILE